MGLWWGLEEQAELIPRGSCFVPWPGATWAILYAYTLAGLRLPDLGRDQRMMFFSCHFHILCPKDGYAFCHNGYVDDDASEAR